MSTDTSPLPPSVIGSVVTVGTFDGVHLGHRFLLQRLSVVAGQQGLPGVLVTFDPHPLAIVRPDSAPPLLTLADERSEVLATTAVDYVVVLRFTQALARLSAEQFVDDILLARLRMRGLLIGHDHGLGKGRAGDVATLLDMGRSRGFHVEVVPAVSGSGGEPVSSSRIRATVARGEVAEAAEALGRAYSVLGRVVPGAQRGRSLGFPTINVVCGDGKLLPGHGVYAVRVSTPQGTFGGMLNHGPRPTFDEPAVTLEAHLFDTAAVLYGAPVRLEFVARLRDVRRFESAEALSTQLGADERAARGALGALTQTL